MIREALKSKRFLIPTILFVGFVVLYVILLSTGNVKYTALPRMLSQWDGQHYLSIARDGYERFPCGWNPNYICGNIGWFPMYPLVVSGVALTGLGARYAVLLVSWLSLWAAILLLYRLVERRFGSRAALFSLTSMLVFPSAFYFLTSFPYSFFLLLAAAAFLMLESGRTGWLWLPAGLLAVTYPSGVVLGLPLFWTLTTRWSGMARQKRLHLVSAIVAIGVALLCYCLYYYLAFGDFWLYLRFQAQSYYAHEPTFPFLPIIDALKGITAGNPVSLMLAFTIVVTVVFFSRRIGVEWFLLMFGILLFTPTMGTTDCYYRHIVVAFPLYVMIGMAADSPRRRYLLPLYGIVSVGLMLAVYLKLYKIGGLM